MTVKQEYALNKVLTALPNDCRDTFREIAEYAVSLGYMPKIMGKRENYADFSKAKLKRTILKINTNPKFPFLSMKFYALPAYSGIFQKAIDERLLTWNRLGYEARCFGCGKCSGTEGYIFTFPDGKQGFLCGFGVLPLPSFCDENISEVKEALRVQDEFFTKQILK